MENDLKYIDDYFQQQLTATEKVDFEKKLQNDQEFAELVAFYSHTKAIERDKILAEKHKEWTNQAAINGKQINFKKVVATMAAMLLVTAGFFYFLNQPNNNFERYSENYIKNDLAQLPIKMDAAQDSLELGKKLYNEKKYHEAFELFGQIKNTEANEYQGLSALQAGDYLRATAIFEQQAANTELLNNKGKFYLALTYLKMGEKAKGKALLKEVVADNMAGKAEAKKILE